MKKVLIVIAVLALVGGVVGQGKSTPVDNAIAVADLMQVYQHECFNAGSAALHTNLGDSQRGQLWLAYNLEKACTDETMAMFDIKTIVQASALHNKTMAAVKKAILSRKRHDPLPDHLE